MRNREFDSDPARRALTRSMALQGQEGQSEEKESFGIGVPVLVWPVVERERSLPETPDVIYDEGGYWSPSETLFQLARPLMDKLPLWAKGLTVAGATFTAASIVPPVAIERAVTDYFSQEEIRDRLAPFSHEKRGTLEDQTALVIGENQDSENELNLPEVDPVIGNLMALATKDISKESRDLLKELGFDPTSSEFRLATEWLITKDGDQLSFESRAYSFRSPDGTENTFNLAWVSQGTGEKSIWALVITGQDTVCRLVKIANEIGGFDLVGVDLENREVIKSPGFIGSDGQINFESGFLFWSEQAGDFSPIELVPPAIDGSRDVFMVEEAQSSQDSQSTNQKQYRVQYPSIEGLALDTLPLFEKIKETVQVSSKLALRVRSGPGTEYPPLGSLKEGGRVEVIGVAPNGWLEIVYLDKDGNPYDFAFVSGAKEGEEYKYVDLISGDMANVPEIAPENLPPLPEPKPVEQPQPAEQQPERPQQTEEVESEVDAFIKQLMPKFNVKDRTSKHFATNLFDPITGLTDAEIDFIVGAIKKHYHVLTPEERQRALLPQMIGASRSAGGKGDNVFVGFGKETLGRSSENNYSAEIREMLVCIVLGHETVHSKQCLEGKPLSEQEAYWASVSIAERLIPYGFPFGYVNFYREKAKEHQ